MGGQADELPFYPWCLRWGLSQALRKGELVCGRSKQAWEGGMLGGDSDGAPRDLSLCCLPLEH